MRSARRWMLVSAVLLLFGCHTHSNESAVDKVMSIQSAKPLEQVNRFANPVHYRVMGKHYDVRPQIDGFAQTGVASWYGIPFHHHATSSGEIYDMNALTAAHKTLPLPSRVLVENLTNHKQIVVKVNDRGPFHEDRIIDLSYAAAKALDFVNQGTAPVKLTLLDQQSRDEKLSSTPVASYVQVGAFKDLKHAYELQAVIQKQHVPVFISQQQSYAIVVCGPFTSTQTHAQVEHLLTRLGITHSYSFFAL